MFMRYRYWSFLGSRSKFVWYQSCQFKSPDSQRIFWFCYCFRNNAEILKFLPQKNPNLKCCFLSVLYVGFETRVSKFACFKRFNPKFFSTKQSGAQKSVIYWKIALKRLYDLKRFTLLHKNCAQNENAGNKLAYLWPYHKWLSLGTCSLPP